MSDVAGPAAATLADQIRELVREGTVELPPFPALASHLQDLLARDEADAARVADMVTNDPGLVASLLRVANSAAFGGLQQITDPKQAIARLGLSQVASMASALLLKGQIKSVDSGHPSIVSVLWDHSVTSAFAARLLAEKIGADATQAFLAGLLHDCGKSLVLKAVDHLTQNGLQLEATGTLLDELMTGLHCELGHLALTTWELPDPLPDIVLHHEDPAENSEDPLLLCVQAADLITQKLGFDLDPDPDLPLLQEPAIENLGIEDMALASLMVDLEDRLDELRKLF